MKGFSHPTTDAVSKEGSLIQWSKVHRVNAKPPKRILKRGWNYTVPVVPVICGTCGQEFEMLVYQFLSKQRHTSLCSNCAIRGSRKSRGVVHPFWKGGRIKRQDGYIAITLTALPIDEQKLFANMAYAKKSNNSGRIMEHRLVMARHLRRPLLKTEHVHHLNHDKEDNRIENLQLVSPSEHADVELTWARSEIERLKMILDKNAISY